MDKSHKRNDLATGMGGLFWMGLIVFVDYISNLVITYFLARLLTPGDFGEVAAITILVGFAELFWQMGVGQAIVQKGEINEEDIVTGHTLNIIFGLFIFIAINLFAGLWTSLFSISSVNMLRVYSFVFIINSILGVPQSLIQKRCNFRTLSIINLISAAFYGASALLFAILGFGVWALVYSTLIKYFIRMILLLLKTRVGFKLGFNMVSAKSLLYFGGGHTIARIYSYIANNGDNFIINKTMGKVYLGSYSKAYSLLMYPANLIGNTLDQVLFPMMARFQDDYAKLKRVLLNGTGIMALISVPISIIAFLCAKDLVFFLLGEQWESTIIPFKIMIIGLFFRMAYKLSDSLIRAIGRVYQRSFVQLIYAASVVISAYIGHFYGLEGVALGVTLSFTINYFLMMFLCMFYIKFKIIDVVKLIMPSFLLGFATILLLNLIKGIWSSSFSYLLTCIITTVITFAIYGSLFFISRNKLIPVELNTMINAIVELILSKLKLKKVKNSSKLDSYLEG